MEKLKNYAVIVPLQGSHGYEKVGDKYVPKYPDDVCNAEGYGLLPEANVRSF